MRRCARTVGHSFAGGHHLLQTALRWRVSVVTICNKSHGDGDAVAAVRLGCATYNFGSPARCHS